MTQRTAILGFGNPCRSDDAVGVYVAQELQKVVLDTDKYSVFDMGTSAFEVLFKLKGHRKIIMVDAVINSGEIAGTLFQLPYQEIQSSVIEDPLVFLHGLKWDQALSYAKKIMQDDFPDDIQVFLVAIDDTRLEIQMSAAVKSAGDKVVQKIIEHLQTQADYA